MNNELIKKAYENFNGKWPSDWSEFIYSTPKSYRLGVCLVDHDDTDGEHKKGDIRQVVVGCNEDCWQIICDQEQFETYGERLKSKPWVPKVGQECEVSIRESEYNKCLVMGFFGELVWLNLHFYDDEGTFSGSRVSLYKSDLKFRPIKTERERQIDELCLIIAGAWGKQTSNPTDLSPIAEDILNAGFQKTTDK